MPAARETIKAVIDTNVMVSALLWNGVSHQILPHVESGRVSCYATLAMLDELDEVLHRDKFSKRIAELRTSPEELLFNVLQWVNVIGYVTALAQTLLDLLEDKDDAVFLQCALNAGAHYLVSGDPHLLVLERCEEVSILSPAQFLHELDKLTSMIEKKKT